MNISLNGKIQATYFMVKKNPNCHNLVQWDFFRQHSACPVRNEQVMGVHHEKTKSKMEEGV